MASKKGKGQKRFFYGLSWATRRGDGSTITTVRMGSGGVGPQLNHGADLELDKNIPIEPWRRPRIGIKWP